MVLIAITIAIAIAIAMVLYFNRLESTCGQKILDTHHSNRFEIQTFY